MQAYRDRVDRQIVPRLGEVRLRELSVGLLDRHLRSTVDNHGLATAKSCHSVLSGCAPWPPGTTPCRTTPLRDLGPLRGKPKKAPAAITVPQMRQLRAALSYHHQAVARDLPDLIAFLMSTGRHAGLSSRAAADQLGRANTSMTTGLYFGRKVAATGVAAVL